MQVKKSKRTEYRGALLAAQSLTDTVRMLREVGGYYTEITSVRRGGRTLADLTLMDKVLSAQFQALKALVGRDRADNVRLTRILRDSLPDYDYDVLAAHEAFERFIRHGLS